MYTKKILSSLSPYFSSIEMLDSSNPLSFLYCWICLLILDLIPAVGFLAEPLLDFGTFVISKDTSMW
jgi:hypothetical protein